MPNDLTQDELTCLAIAAEGENMLQIGRWEAPIQSLVKRGLMRSIDKFNNVITPRGKEAAAKIGDGVDTRYAEVAIKVHNAQAEYNEHFETAAQELAKAVLKRQELTGQFPNQCAYGMAQELLARVLEILG